MFSGKKPCYTQNISDSGNHLLAVINDILDLARVEAGMTQLTLKSSVYSMYWKMVAQ